MCYMNVYLTSCAVINFFEEAIPDGQGRAICEAWSDWSDWPQPSLPALSYYLVLSK